MATLKDNYEVQGNELIAYLGGARWYCQTFTTTSAYTINSVEFYMWKQNANDAHLLYCYLYALDGSDKPTGVALATGSITLASVPEGLDNKDWVLIEFASGYALSNATKYGLVIYCPDADYSDIGVGVDSNQGYATGLQWYSTDGTNWAANNRDQFFRTYEGDAATEYDEGVLVVTGAGVVVLASESGTFVYAEDTLVVAGAGVVVLIGEAYQDTSGWPMSRSTGYDPDKWWDEETGAWVSTFVQGPGSRVEHLLVIGEEGEIYYGVV